MILHYKVFKKKEIEHIRNGAKVVNNHLRSSRKIEHLDAQSIHDLFRGELNSELEEEKIYLPLKSSECI